MIKNPCAKIFFMLCRCQFASRVALILKFFIFNDCVQDKKMSGKRNSAFSGHLEKKPALDIFYRGGFLAHHNFLSCTQL